METKLNVLAERHGVRYRRDPAATSRVLGMGGIPALISFNEACRSLYRQVKARRGAVRAKASRRKQSRLRLRRRR